MYIISPTCNKLLYLVFFAINYFYFQFFILCFTHAQLLLTLGSKPGRYQIEEIEDESQGKQGGSEKAVEGQKNQDFAFEGGAFFNDEPLLKPVCHVQTSEQAKYEQGNPYGGVGEDAFQKR